MILETISITMYSSTNLLILRGNNGRAQFAAATHQSGNMAVHSRHCCNHGLWRRWGRKYSTPAPTSTWAGTYTGNLNFSGCPSSTSCGGDSIAITIAEALNSSISGEFLPALTITGVDNTTRNRSPAQGRLCTTGPLQRDQAVRIRTQQLRSAWGTLSNSWGVDLRRPVAPCLSKRVSCIATLWSRGPMYRGRISAP